MVLSIAIYVAYMWISNFAFSSTIINTTETFFTSPEAYLVTIFGVCLVLFFDGFILSIDYDNSGTLKKLREIIDQDKQFNAS